MIETIKDFLLTCPAVNQKAKSFSINFLGAAPLEYSIEAVPGEPVLRRYVNGASIRQRLYNIDAREAYTMDAKAQARHMAEIGALCSWIEAQSSAGNFPQIPGGTVQQMTVTSSPYLMSDDKKTALYRIQLQITYYSEV